MKVLFHHEPFYRDVSSGNDHAAYQWMELFLAMGVTQAAVVNTSGVPYPQVSDNLVVEDYPTMADFTAAHPGERVDCVSPHASTSFKDYDFTNVGWIVFGGTSPLAVHDILIPTEGNRELYPREAAAIILARIKWP